MGFVTSQRFSSTVSNSLTLPTFTISSHDVNQFPCQSILLMEGIRRSPPGMYKTLQSLGETTNLNWLAGFLPSTVSILVFQVSFPKLKRFALPGGTALCLALLGRSAEPPVPREAASGGASGADQVSASGGAAVGASEMRGLTRMWRCWPLERFSWTILGERKHKGKLGRFELISLVQREVFMSEMQKIII